MAIRLTQYHCRADADYSITQRQFIADALRGHVSEICLSNGVRIEFSPAFENDRQRVLLPIIATLASNKRPCGRCGALTGWRLLIAEIGEGSNEALCHWTVVCLDCKHSHLGDTLIQTAGTPD